MAYRVAVVGATGAVGREILNILAERNFPVSKVHAVASQASVGREVSFGEDAILKVEALDSFDFKGVDIALFSPGGKISAVHAPRAAAAGCVVIDNTSHFRMDPDVPLVTPEVNADAVGGYAKKGIIANPNCSTIPLVVALKPLHEAFGVKRVVASTYQSVSGGGKAAMDELFNQTRGVFVNDQPEPEVFPKRIAFNLIPRIDTPLEDGSTKEEWKMRVETKKMLDPDIEVFATCVRTPVFVAHAISASVEFVKPVTPADARALLRDAPGVQLVDDVHADVYATPAECAGEDAVFVSRLRTDPSVPNGLGMWLVADNLRKGAALNAVQIAEVLIADHLRAAA
ncbi:MAG: aspartate-semialdehyde dehydrogenase [Pseudomonadota bacterium]